MAKNNLTPVLLIGAAAAAFFLFKRKAEARQVMTDDGTKIETDVTTTETGAPVNFEETPDESGGDNFLSKVIPVVKDTAKSIIKKVKAKRTAKRAAKKTAVPKKKKIVRVKKAKKVRPVKKARKRRSRVKGFDSLPVLY